MLLFIHVRDNNYVVVEVVHISYINFYSILYPYVRIYLLTYAFLPTLIHIHIIVVVRSYGYYCLLTLSTLPTNVRGNESFIERTCSLSIIIIYLLSTIAT